MYVPGQVRRASGVWGNRHSKLARLSTLRTGRLYPLGDSPGTHFCWWLSRPKGHRAVGGIKPIKKLIDFIRNRTRDLPDRSAVAPPSTPPRTQKCQKYKTNTVEKIQVYRLIIQKNAGWGHTRCLQSHSAALGIIRLRSAAYVATFRLLVLCQLSCRTVSIPGWTNSGLLEGCCDFKYSEYPLYRLVLMCVWLCKESEGYGGSEPKSPALTTRTLLTCTASTLRVAGTTRPILRTTCCV